MKINWRPRREHIPKIVKAIIILLSLGFVLAPVYITQHDSGLAFVAPRHNFPRLANLYWKTAITREEAKELSKWNLVVLDMQAQNLSPENIRYLRELNPKIIILAYTSANEIPIKRLNEVEPAGQGLWHDLASQAKPQWQLKTYNGQEISWWPGNISMNPYAKDGNGQSYSDFLVGFYRDKILGTGLWDGILFDNVWQNVSWVNPNIDIDGDGQWDNQEKIDRLWREGNTDFFKKLRQNIGSKYLILGNGDGEYHDFINGRMFEAFPDIWQGGWIGSIKKYLNLSQNGYTPRINIINSDTKNTGNYQDWQKLRFSLASALMSDGYFSFDFGSQLREQLWWYDEYSVNLGQAKGEAFNLLEKNNKEIKAGVWQRDYENGLAIVNTTNKEQTINFDGEYEKIHGTQDKLTNNGAIINQLTLKAQDGIILLRPIEKITGATFINGSFARIFDESGKNTRTGFFAYDNNYRGSNKIIYLDLNGDHKNETIVAGDNTLSFYNNDGGLVMTLYPYGEKFHGGINLTAADLNKDGNQEIITAPEKGGSNLIKIFNAQGENLFSFNAYKAVWVNLGASIASCDVNGDGEPEIVTGAGWNGGPHVKIFNKDGKILIGEFFAYNVNFRGGVNVACGDVNGDGRGEIVTGAGWNGGPHVEIFTDRGIKISQWMAYDPNKRQGVNVTVSDINQDGRDEIIALTTNVFTSSFIQQ